MTYACDVCTPLTEFALCKLLIIYALYGTLSSYGITQTRKLMHWRWWRKITWIQTT